MDKIKVSDFVANFLIKNNLSTLFTLTGGFAMHLNDSFGKHGDFDIHYQHHEQACAYSATGFTKTNSKPCIVCTTAGVAATNAISPCLVAHQDSLPILFISGQVKSNETIKIMNNENMNLRHYAGADCDIISMVKSITKYSCEIYDVLEIENILDHFSAAEISEIWITFPDPQPQISRERKRLTSVRFLTYYQNLLKPNGIVHLKTDSDALYEYTHSLIQDKAIQVLAATTDLYNDEMLDELLQIQTTYEKKYLAVGKNINYLKFSFE